MGKDKTKRSTRPLRGHSMSNHYSLTTWLLGAARHQLSLAERAPTGTEIHGAAVAQRVAAVLFAAAAFESWENGMWDEIARGDAGLRVTDFDGVLSVVEKDLHRLEWPARLRLLTLLWSPGNRWVVAQSVFNEVLALRKVRNRLVHPSPEIEDLHGDRHTAATTAIAYTHPPFTPDDATSLPPLLRDLTPARIRGFIDAVELAIARVRSLKDLPGAPPEGKPLIEELDGDGGRTWVAGADELGGPDGAQVRWCGVTQRYVLHRFAVQREMNGFGKPLEGVPPVDGTRICEVMMKCRRVRECPWTEIRTAQEARAKKDDVNAMRRARGLPPIE